MSKMKEQYGNIIRADGLDDALLGVDYLSERAIYSVSGIVKIYMDRDFMTFDEAIKYFEFNVAGSLLGKGGPIYCNDL